ncbi:uracil-DNA glycosylase family protein [Qipengyuania sp. S6317L1]|uniref:uracil-DNA glycosylase family protein n=1 Tax=Qipengyuania sp. S6317L1 TaxID=2926410 RepID=UPI001FF539EB|nr:uracil-DNA glycosylase family protein [Qipengyuania sp. S6317L1]MCK0100335.1 uracil-DNA glycosylase family protein [Qipengyuania sp. S6317L1]
MSSAALHDEIKACTLCAEHLPLGPRPIVQFSSNSRILIIGQAPGTKVHTSGIPWDDDSGDRLRDWVGLEKSDFYDAAKVAIMPMGFCYPGKAKGGDAPPRKECAPQWHDQILAHLPRTRLTLLVGSYAQAQYLPLTRKLSLTDRVGEGEQESDALGPVIPLPHPSWRVRMWIGRNPWFETDIVPRLQTRVAQLV